MDRRDATRLSKFLSLVLRHRPDEYDLEMDDQGYVDFASLMDVLAAEDVLGSNAEEDVLELVEGSDRRRFEVRDGRIRALYGHSSRIKLDYPEGDPPATLYHGTSLGGAHRVLAEGVKPSGRAFVHLSSTEAEALAVGGRHTDDPFLIRIDTGAAREKGVRFHQATDLIWVCGALPAEVCEIPELPDASAEMPEAPPAPEARKAAPPPPTSGVQVVEPEAGAGFKRRTKKRNRR